MAENNLGNTQYFRTKPDQELQVKEVLDLVYTAMARSMIMKVERDELVEELLNEYIKNKSWER